MEVECFMMQVIWFDEMEQNMMLIILILHMQGLMGQMGFLDTLQKELQHYFMECDLMKCWEVLLEVMNR